MRWASVGSKPHYGGLLPWLRCAHGQWREIALAAGSFVAYFGAGHIPGLKAHPVPYVKLDYQTPLLPWTVYGYVSLYPLLLANLVYFVPRPRTLQPLLRAITLANVLAGTIFVSYRTSIQRPPMRYAAGSRMLAWVWAVDPPYNALPSLHTTYGLLVAWVHIKVQSPCRLLVGIWSTVVIVTTLTTKQHQALDLVGGAVLAAVVSRVTLHHLCPTDLALVARAESPAGYLSPEGA